MEKERSIPIWRDVGSIIIAVVVALVIRTVAAEPFNVPSASMLPTLLVGDTLLASKYPYGFSRYSLPMDALASGAAPYFNGRALGHPPDRGDVVVFKLPRDPSINYVKRIIGLPGDRIQMREGTLYINDVAVPRREDGVHNVSYRGREYGIRRYIETLPGGREHQVVELSDSAPYDNTSEFTVPPEHYFAMGDNRDDSEDSRATAERGGVGFVPAENLVGRVDVILYSREGEVPWYHFGDMLRSFRDGRAFISVK